MKSKKKTALQRRPNNNTNAKCYYRQSPHHRKKNPWFSDLLLKDLSFAIVQGKTDRRNYLARLLGVSI